MNTVYRPFPPDPRYIVSDTGEIVGPRGKLSQFEARGYRKVQLGGKQWRVNRVVCWAFHGAPPSDEHHAAHKDGNRKKNTPDNLYWATRAENAADLARHGSLAGSNHGRHILNSFDVDYIRSRRAAGERLTEIHKDYPQVSYPTVSHVANNRNWKGI